MHSGASLAWPALERIKIQAAFLSSSGWPHSLAAFSIWSFDRSFVWVGVPDTERVGQRAGAVAPEHILEVFLHVETRIACLLNAQNRHR